MTSICTLLALALASFYCSAGEQRILYAVPDAGGTKGLIQVEWEPRYALRAGVNKPTGILTVRRIRGGGVLQKIPVTTSAPYATRFSLEFADLNDDGYQDLLFYNSVTGTAGASRAADVFVWNPATVTFKQSEELSQMGEITKLNERGCVEIEWKRSITSYAHDVFCYNDKNGRWTQREDNPKCGE